MILEDKVEYTMSHVFISYKSDDRDAVKAVVDRLMRLFYVWFDKADGIPPGSSDWKQEISDGIDGASVLVLMLSPRAIESPWVEYEYTEALKRGKKVVVYQIERVPSLPKAIDTSQIVKSFEDLIKPTTGLWDARIHTPHLVPAEAIHTQGATFGQLAEQYPDDVLRPSSANANYKNVQLIGLPVMMSNYTKTYLVGRANDTTTWYDTVQVIAQFNERNFSLERSPSGAFPQDKVLIDVANKLMENPSTPLRMFLVRSALNQPYVDPERLSYGLQVESEDDQHEWRDVLQALKQTLTFYADRSRLQLFINGPGIITYAFGAHNAQYVGYDLYQFNFTKGYVRVLSS